MIKYSVTDEYGRIVEQNISLSRAQATIKIDPILRIVRYPQPLIEIKTKKTQDENV